MDQKDEVIEWVSEATSVVPDVSMLPRNGEHMQWWPIPSLRCTQVRLHSDANKEYPFSKLAFSPFHALIIC